MTTVSVCVPARDEAATVASVVTALGRESLVEELIVVDDSSSDETAAVAAAAGARVVRADDIHPLIVKGPGKGEAMWKGAAAATGEVIVFCDADLEHVPDGIVERLVRPLLTSSRAVMVKATYTRSLHGRSGEGGRVTELLARPLLTTLFPEVAHIRQPLAGEYAVRRSVLEDLALVGGYGVDLAMLIDIARARGADSVVQVDLGVRAHRNRPLHDLTAQAEDVLRAGLHRGGVSGLDIVELPRLRSIR